MYKIASIFSFSIFVGLKIEKLLDLNRLIKPVFLQFAIRLLRYFTDLRMVLLAQSSLKITMPFLCAPEFDD